MRATRLFALAAVLLVAACDDGGANETATRISATLAPESRQSGAPTQDSVLKQPDGLSFDEVDLDGTTIEYVRVLPDHFDSTRDYPLLLALPPGGQDHQTTEAVAKRLYADEAQQRGWIVVSPVAPDGALFYDDPSASLLIPFLDAMEQRFPPAGGRAFLAGVSNGGLSAFRLALDHPERFQAMVVFPGYPPDGVDGAAFEKMKNLPVAMFVGGDDSAWLGPSQQTKAALERVGDRVTLDVRPGEDHIIRSLTGAQLFDALTALTAPPA